MIAGQLGIGDDSLSFFQSYGEQLTAMWDSFKLNLNRQAETQTDEEIVINAAYSTFSQFKAILDRD